MPIERTAKWVDPPNTRVNFKEGDAKILQFIIDQDISSEESFEFHAYKTSLREGCILSSKVLPLIMQMWETKGDKRFYDVYSFDNNGLCLSHGYSRYENGEKIADEEHDQDTKRLVEKTGLIHQLAGDFPLPGIIQIHDPLPALLGGRYEG